MTWKAFWFGSLTLLVLVEMWAVVRVESGDTLTEQILPYLADPLVWTLSLSAWIVFAAWIVWHFWLGRDRWPR